MLYMETLKSKLILSHHKKKFYLILHLYEVWIVTKFTIVIIS